MLWGFDGQIVGWSENFLRLRDVSARGLEDTMYSLTAKGAYAARPSQAAGANGASKSCHNVSLRSSDEPERPHVNQARISKDGLRDGEKSFKKTALDEDTSAATDY
jgi:hypothetical protein